MSIFGEISIFGELGGMVEGGASSGDFSSTDETGETIGEIRLCEGLTVTPADWRTLRMVGDNGFTGSGGATGGRTKGGLLAAAKVATFLARFWASL